MTFNNSPTCLCYEETHHGNKESSPSVYVVPTENLEGYDEIICPHQIIRLAHFRTSINLSGI